VSDDTTTEQSPLLQLEHISKRYGGAVALEQVSVALQAGEIHALLGENGAGKSTLIKILGGIVRADSGTIRMDGQAQAVKNVADADRLGIRIIHQELSLVPAMTVAENIYLGREPRRCGFLSRRQMNQDARQLVERLGLKEIEEVETPLFKMRVAQRQLVEIARALATDARILVLDEQTSALTAGETQRLFLTLRRLRDQGTGIIYISHRLEEIMLLADRITVLRDGRSVGTRRVCDVSKSELIRWMIGREVADYFQKPVLQESAVVFEARNVKNPHVDGVSFSLKAGEILGIAGLVGSGRSELARALFGMDALEEGELRLNGTMLNLRSPRDALRAGIVCVPEDRQREGLVMLQTLSFNLALPWTRDWNPHILPDRRKKDAIVHRAMASFAIKAKNPAQNIATLSGGNQQKALVARWMEHRPKVLILDEPARGIDVGAREDIFRILFSLAESGMSIILISSDLNETLGMSHRIAIYRDRRIVTVLPAAEADQEKIMKLLTGVQVS